MTHASQRERISWRPVWDQSFKGWTINFIKRNKWRCDSILGYDDLLQDCMLIFYKCIDRYPAVIDAKHFMSLYKVSIINHFHDNSRYKRLKDDLMVDAPNLDDLLAVRIGEVTNPGYAMALIEEMPEELKLVLAHLTEGKVRIRIDKSTRNMPLRVRESLNQRLCRKLGLKTTTDPVGDLRRFIQA